MGDRRSGRRDDERSAARSKAPGTLAVHAGEHQSVPRSPAVLPIYQTAPFLFASAGELGRAFASGDPDGLYSRYGNPSVRAVEEKVAALEGADDAVAFASGMAAISTTLSTLLSDGDRLVASADLYGGTHAWLGWLAEHHPSVRIDRLPLARLADDLGEEPARAVYFETPTNPTVACGDVARIAEAAHRVGALAVVDSTFATPILQNPLALGADLVVHSATKALAGHSDVMAGVVAGGEELIAEVRSTLMNSGASLDPHAAFLVARGMKTLALRVERQSVNAARLAELAREHPRVARVFYPGFDPVGRQQMRAGGSMLAIELGAGGAGAERLLEALEIFQIIPSLGGVESGVMIPATTSHRQLSAAERAARGIADGLVRVSCGIEDPDDLAADLERGLAAA